MDGKTALENYRPNLEPYKKVYRDIHQDPELSKQEVQTASIVASHLEKLGDYIVHQGIGGHGVVGVLSNGKGPTVLLCAELDTYVSEVLPARIRNTNSENMAPEFLVYSLYVSTVLLYSREVQL